MSRRARRAVRTALGLPVVTFVTLVATAAPAAAHDVDAGSLPAPAWLLGYLGAFAALATALALRTGWPAARFATGEPGPSAALTAPRLGAGSLVAASLLGATVVAALAGENMAAANIAPVTTHVLWWVGLPLIALLLGDVLQRANPFLPLVALLERVLPAPRPTGPAPAWTAGAMLLGFRWLYLAYYRPGSPRAVAVLLLAYAAAAAVGGWWWGRSWLVTGEGFGALSRAVAGLRRGRLALPGAVLLPLAVAWLSATAFDAVSATSFWGDVLGTTRGWTRTGLGTVGVAWVTLVVGAAAMALLRAAPASDDAAAEAGEARPAADLARADAGQGWGWGRPLAVAVAALLPLALVWAVAHDLTLLLFEGQNFLILLSDPLGRGWDLLGTYDWSVDADIVQAGWVRAVQLGALLAGHVGGVVLAHDAALARDGRRRATPVTWAAAALAAVSAVAVAYLVLA